MQQKTNWHTQLMNPILQPNSTVTNLTAEYVGSTKTFRSEITMHFEFYYK